MALRRLAMLRSAEGNTGCSPLVLVRWTHSIVKPSPLDSVFSNTVVSPQFVLPESDRSSDTNGFGFSCLPFGGGSMELMAVPRKKVSRHKRGIRNGPKALKPVPVIIRCKLDFVGDSSCLRKKFIWFSYLIIAHRQEGKERVCGRVKLPHFFCCSGERGTPGEENGSTS